MPPSLSLVDGAFVVLLQAKLNAAAPAATSPLLVDGFLGPSTQARLMQFQSANNIAATGVTGPDTWSALLGANPSDFPALSVRGNTLYNQSNIGITLRGIDLPLLDDWNFPVSEPLGKLQELSQTGANAVRIQWYTNYGQAGRPAYTMSNLDRVLAACRGEGLIPIVMLADLTCNSDPTQVSSLVEWWTSDTVDRVLSRHSDHLIINIANELGAYHWAGDDAAQAAALETYAKAYQGAIAQLRSAGVLVPLMIDAPDCGTSLDGIVSVGAGLVAADPLNNLLLSVHAYWAATDYTSQIAPALAAGLPLVFGEIANKQDEVVNGQNVYGYYDLDGSGQNHAPVSGFTYQSLLPLLQANSVGWLAWSWWPDACGPRQLSSDGTFTGLTGYGNDIVNNASYGLKVASNTLPGRKPA